MSGAGQKSRLLQVELYPSPGQPQAQAQAGVKLGEPGSRRLTETTPGPTHPVNEILSDPLCRVECSTIRVVFIVTESRKGLSDSDLDVGVFYPCANN